MTVVSSGSFLSTLLFKLKNVPGDAEGFLLGKVCSHQVENITDSQSTGHREEKKICLHSFVTLDSKHSFYDRCGSPDAARLEDILRDRFQDVIGWFSYRRNSSHRLSMMEKSIHRKLAHCFTHIQKQDFILALITEQLVDMSTVHSSEYSFRCWDGGFKMVDSEMLTLPPSIPYQIFPFRLLPPHLTHYNSVLKEQRSKLTSTEGAVVQCTVVEQLCAAMIEKLEPLGKELLATSEAVLKASHEVARLRAEVAAMKASEEQAKLDISRNCAHHPDIEVVGEAVAGGVSTDMLIDFGAAESIDQSQTLMPSLDLLSNGTEMLVPKKPSPDTQHSTPSKSQEPSIQYVSQELF